MIFVFLVQFVFVFLMHKKGMPPEEVLLTEPPTSQSTSQSDPSHPKAEQERCANVQEGHIHDIAMLVSESEHGDFNGGTQKNVREPKCG